MFWKNLIYGIRTLKKNRLYSSINVIGFSIGLASFITIALFVEREYSFDLHYVDSDNVYRISLNLHSVISNENTAFVWSDAHLLDALRDSEGQVEAVSGLQKTEKAVKIEARGKNFIEDNFYYADSNYFQVFHIIEDPA